MSRTGGDNTAVLKDKVPCEARKCVVKLIASKEKVVDGSIYV